MEPSLCTPVDSAPARSRRRRPLPAWVWGAAALLLAAYLGITLVLFLAQVLAPAIVCPLWGCVITPDLAISYYPHRQCRECISDRGDPRLARTPLETRGAEYYLGGHLLPVGETIEFSILALTLNPWRLDELRVSARLYDQASGMGTMLQGDWVSGSIIERVWPSPVALVLLVLDAWLVYRFGRARPGDLVTFAYQK